MILPVYASLERLDVSLIEAGKDLYHGPVRTFFRVTLPATRAGLYGGVLLVFLPALGDFVSAQLLGGASTYMMGNLVQQQFMEGQNWPLGSALTVGMMAALTVLMVIYLRATSTRPGVVMARGKLERTPLVPVVVTVVSSPRSGLISSASLYTTSRKPGPNSLYTSKQHPIILKDSSLYNMPFIFREIRVIRG